MVSGSSVGVTRIEPAERANTGVAKSSAQVPVDGEEVVLDSPGDTAGAGVDQHRNGGLLGAVDHPVGRASEHPLAEATVARRTDDEDAAVGLGGLDQPVGDRRRRYLGDVDVHPVEGGDGVGRVLRRASVARRDGDDLHVAPSFDERSDR